MSDTDETCANNEPSRAGWLCPSVLDAKARAADHLRSATTFFKAVLLFSMDLFHAGPFKKDSTGASATAVARNSGS